MVYYIKHKTSNNMDLTKILQPLGGEKFIALLMKGVRIDVAGGDYDNRNSDLGTKITIRDQVIYLPQPQLRIVDTTFNWELSITTPIEIVSSEVIYPISFTVYLADLHQINPLEFIYQVTTHQVFDELHSPIYNLECDVKPIFARAF